MEAQISAVGTALPPYEYDQKEVAEFMQSYLSLDGQKARWLRKAYESSGIGKRHSVLPDFKLTNGDPTLFNGSIPETRKRMKAFEQEAGKLGTNAAQRCLSENQVDPESVTHLITVSCTGLHAPGLDIELIQNLGLPSTTERTGIQFMGCYAAFNALKAAGHIVQANPEARVLITAVELCSLHFQASSDQDQMLANALFGDGAGSALVEHSSVAKPGLWLKAFKSDLIPESGSAMTWNIGDEGFEMFLSRHIPGHIKEALKPHIDNLLSENNQAYADIGHLAAHPGGIRILDTIEQTLPLAEPMNKASRSVLENYGNMSSPTVLFVIEQLLNQDKDQSYPPGMLGMAFGPGLTVETGLFEVLN
jgi:alpha-pyrone synthase